MSLKILCSGHLVRHPLGGHTWHHLQYLVGFERLGHEVVFFEHFGWEQSCYDAANDAMTSDPGFGIAYMTDVFERVGWRGRWCFLAEDGQSHGMSRDELAQFCRDCDVYFNLSNLNWIDELEHCRRRVLVDTDPVFTQIGALGMGGPFSRYNVLFTYGENVHKPGCEMPTAGVNWLPTRQPVVLDLWKTEAVNADAPLTTVVNWSPIEDQIHQGKVYGQKDREFEPYFALPREMSLPMEIAANAPSKVTRRLREGGWKLVDAREVSRDPWSYQDFLRRSHGEFCVAKHGYVSTRCGWFSDRSAAYLASGRPVVVQDTGFSEFLPCGKGLLPFQTHGQALDAIHSVVEDPQSHGRAARQIIEEHFDAQKVLSDLLAQSL